MFVILAIVIGVLYATGLYMMLSRSIVKVIFGLVLLGHAANLLIFVGGGLVRAIAPLIAADQTTVPEGAADPVPQALVLTAIVIGFALTAFAAALVKRTYEAVGTDDPDVMRLSDT